MAKLKGKVLHKGSRIGLTSPAGPVKEKLLEEAISAVKELGFDVEVGMTCYENFKGYLAGPPGMRARELQWMFANPKIKAILCLRGGYGSPQILQLIDYKEIKKSPKLFVGYSDITALHIALQQRCNLVTIHGPMPASDLINAETYTITSLLQILTYSSVGMVSNPSGQNIECLVPGTASGEITGGNLSLITSLMGTPFEMEAKGKLLLLEEVDEPLYKIDRMLTQLALSGVFDQVNGVILGTWTDCHEENAESSLIELFERIIAPFNKPVIYNVRAGHCQPTVSLPLGVQAKINANIGKLTIEESHAIK